MLAYLLFDLLLAASGIASPAAPPSTSPVVRLTSGSFRGVSAGAPNNTDKWLGIPFAQPPVGSLRFKAPVPLIDPSAPVKDANQFGNACPQEPSNSLGAPQGESCLFLNVRQRAYLSRYDLNTFEGLEACRDSTKRRAASISLVLCR